CAPASALTFFSPVTSFEDDDLDAVIDVDGNGEISVGDRLVSVIKWTRTSGIFAGQGPVDIGPAEELTGLADITVSAIVGNQIFFAPSGAAGLLAAFAPGTMVATWLDGTPDLDVINSNCGNQASCI